MTTAQRGHEPRGVAAGRTVVIVGAGPGGLVAARYLKSEGFAPVIVEQGDGIGGQWYGEARHSGVWPGMRTNTSRIMTSFSDLSHDERIPVYPTHQDMRMYLQRYAETFDLVSCVRTRTRVEGIARAPAENGWAVRLRDEHGTEVTDVFPRVIVATGRHQRPVIPPMPGLSSFTGSGAIIHTFDYKHPERYRDLRVLVCGGSISALEIASDLAMLGTARVVSSSRRQRYVLQKLLAGVPTDHLAFTRFGALAEECMPPEVVANGLQDLIARSSGNPEHYGALAPAENVLEAGLTLSQHFLPLVAEGRIDCRPWPREVRGQAVRFADGHEEPFDALIFGTGYQVSLPFLDPATRRTLDADVSHLDLHRFTFHPDLPGLAFLGLFELVGPYFPVLELQARWIAYTWSGARPTPSPEDLRAGVAAYRSRRGGLQLVPMHAAAIMFAREVGAEPVLQQWPQLARPLLFGPLTPMSFRLSGPDHLPEASDRVVSDAMAFGAVPSMELTNEQRLQLQALATAKNDRRFAQYVQEMTAHERNAAPIRL